MPRIRTPTDELYRRAVAYVDRRGGALIRRGGRSGGGAWGKKRFDAGKMYAIGGFSAANSFATQSGGGEIGLTSGFGAVIGLRLNKLGGAARHLLNRCNGIVNGWVPYINADRIQAWFGNGTNSFVTPYYQLVASDIGKLITFAIWLDGTKARLAVSRAQIGDGTAFTGTFAPYTGPTVFSGLASNVATGPATDVDLLVQGTFRGVPTQTQLEALFDLVRQKGDLPTPAEWPYGISHGWSLREELARASVPVIDGQLAPASVADTVTAAAIDRMDRQGSPTVKLIDPSTDGRKTYGALGFSASAYLSSAPGAGIRGAGTGFTIRCTVTFWSTATGISYFANCANTSGTTGWAFARNAANLSANVGDGTARAVTKVLAASDLGIRHLLHLVMDATGAVEFFFDGVSVGKSAAGSWIAALASIPMQIGVLSTSLTFPATNETIWELVGGHYIASAAECTADFAAWQLVGKLIPIAGKPDLHGYDITQDVVANGGAANGVPGTVLDRIGTDHITRVGGIRVATSPTTLITDFDTGHVYCGEALLGSATFWASCLIAPETLTGTRVIFGRSDHANGGWYFYNTGSLMVVRAYGTDGASVEAPYTSLPAGRIGTLVHLALRISGGFLQLFLDGLPIGAPAAIVGYKPWPTVKMTIGATNGGSVYAARGIGFAGGGGGDFAPSDAEILTHAQTCLTAQVWQPIAAKTDTSIQINADVADAGGGVPVMLKNRQTGAAVAVKLGAPLQVAQRAERLWSYEAA